jgi:predicted unusual protein kinase regulating ubiquinone biosynthesis (AarF/ABC1/UbiB family)
MGISLQPKHLKRYKDIARLMMKYGRSDMVSEAGLEEVFQEEEVAEDASTTADADQFAKDLENLGPTFIKLGQVLSTRADLMPEAYMKALSRLQDSVEPFSYEEVEEIVSQELGARISKAFGSFEPEPLAAASLGQVHRATLRDGRAVAVKVQRPHIREQIRDDLEVLDQIAQFLEEHTETGKRYELTGMLEEFRSTLVRELDYKKEAANLTIIGHNLAELALIVVPDPIDDYTTSRILTMEFIRGRKVTKLSPLQRMEIEGAALAEELFRAYLKQILVDGIFHADPHPGNVFLTDDGRIALLDLGMVAQLSPDMQLSLLRLILALADGRGDEVAEISIQLSHQLRDFDEQGFRRAAANLVAQYKHTNLKELQAGRVMLELTRIGGEYGVVAPAELALLGKTLLSLDVVGRTLDPDFDPNAAINRNAAETMRQRMIKQFSPSNIFSTLLETTELVQNLPRRVNKFLEQAADNKLEIKVNAIDEVRLMAGLQKIANRITLGLVLAALILGAALLMRVPTSWHILGYPALAIIFFVIAAGAGMMLAYNIVTHDEPDKPKDN